MIDFDELDDLGVNYGSRPEDLRDEHIDEAIRDTIYKINNSDWIKTLWCCAGHAGGQENSMPYLSLAVKATDLNKIIDMIDDSSKITEDNNGVQLMYKGKNKNKGKKITQIPYQLYYSVLKDYAHVSIYPDTISYCGKNIMCKPITDAIWEDARGMFAKIADLISE